LSRPLHSVAARRAFAPTHAQSARDRALQALLDKDAIRDLVLSYSRAVDRQDFALLRTLYADDAVEDDHGGLYAGPAEGYVDWLMQVMPRLGITAHCVQNHLIIPDGDGCAQGEVYVTAYHRMREEGGRWSDLVHGMRYLDHYVKRNGVWLFGRRTVTVDWKQVGPCCWDPAEPDVVKAAQGTHDRDDPSYSVLEHPFFARRD
jgi:hypothetical protein